MALATPRHVTPADVLDYLLTVTSIQETLSYGGGRGYVRRFTLPLDYTPAWLAPLWHSIRASMPHARACSTNWWTLPRFMAATLWP